MLFGMEKPVKFDQSYRWEKIAEARIREAMKQQPTEKRELTREELRSI